MGFLDEIQRRRTFGIISHPDAGKTTLTEKLLLFGGAIQEAGAVKNNKIKKGATSDFMEIERQRGISVSTSVLAFNYKDKKINILDTPGHKDFAEDTFRTLTAVDSVIVVIDVAKGVEEQTEKLVAVCRMRKIPIIVFINKLDREGKDAFDLMDEVEQKLGLRVTPLSFPIGMGYDFQGIYNLWEQNINLFSGDSRKNIEETIAFSDVQNQELEKIIGQKPADRLREELELIDEVYPKFDRQDYLDGKLQPVFFGSALNNFGVRELLDCFVQIAPSPRPKDSETRLVDPKEEKMTGFVFKIHANMDPKHRDRLAFIKIVSGTFETEGWSVFKFSNLDSNGQPGKNTLWVDTDFPMFRLGDIYLMYAEAVARGGEGSKASAVEYINALRKRAYGDEKHNISENWLEENNFRNLLDERGRELYWEGIRRTDLVRFDLLTSGSYTWDFKGGINTGVGVNKRYNVYPIPVTDLTVNGNLQQNEGY